MSVFSTSEPRIRLPDQVTVDFGPTDLLGRAFLQLDRSCRDRGIYLSISHDMHQLAEANLANRKDWYALPPMFDVAYGGLTRDNAFWLSGVNEQGELVLTNACRLYFWPETSFHDELEAMRFFYTDPETQKGPNEYCAVDTDDARAITGRVSYGGAIWVRPDYRGLGLAHIAPRIARAYALTRWYPDFMLGMVNSSTVEGTKASQTYGWPHLASGIRLCGLEAYGKQYGAEIGFHYSWFDRREVTDDLGRFLQLTTAEPATAAAA